MSKLEQNMLNKIKWDTELLAIQNPEKHKRVLEARERAKQKFLEEMEQLEETK